MISCTLSVTIDSIETQARSDGKTIVFGSCTFPQGDGTAMLPFRTLGDVADGIAQAGRYTKGIAYGYIDSQKVAGKTVESLVIRDFSELNPEIPY
jgi:hypothetical protein